MIILVIFIIACVVFILYSNYNNKKKIKESEKKDEHWVKCMMESIEDDRRIREMYSPEKIMELLKQNNYETKIRQDSKSNQCI